MPLNDTQVKFEFDNVRGKAVPMHRGRFAGSRNIREISA
jgi:hypothetical protein